MAFTVTVVYCVAVVSVEVCAGVGGTVAVTVDVDVDVDVDDGVKMSRTVVGVALTVVLEKVVVGLLSIVVVPPFTAVEF